MSKATEFEAFLRESDDLVHGRVLAKAMGVTWPLALGTLQHLHRHKVIDFVMQGGDSYWFALPKEMDTRQFKMRAEVHREVKSRHRKPSKTKNRKFMKLRRSKS